MRKPAAWSCLAATYAFIVTSALQAQTVDPKVVAQQVGTAGQAQVAQTVVDQAAPQQVPGYQGTDLPQSQYLDNPNQLAGDGATVAAVSEPYQIVVNPQRAQYTGAATDLTNAKIVEANPTKFTGSGVTTGTAQGTCTQLPPSPPSNSTYYQSCEIGDAEVDHAVTCNITWDDHVTSSHGYTCTTTTIDHQVKTCTGYKGKVCTGYTTSWVPVVGSAGPDRVSSCTALAAAAGCSETASAVVHGIGPVPSAIATAGVGKPFSLDGETDTYSCTAAVTPMAAQNASEAFLIDNGKSVFTAYWAISTPATVDNGITTTYSGSSQDTSDCQKKTAGLTCEAPTQVCTDASPTTRTIDGVPVEHDCWQWQATYQCATLTGANDCGVVKQQNNCTFDHEECLDDPQVGDCKVESEVYKCTTPNPSQNPGVTTCGGDVYCLDGSCTTLPTSPTPDVANALVAINAMGDATKQLDTTNFTIFDGKAAGCHKPLFGLVNCCAGKVSGMLTAAASAIALAGIATGNFAFLAAMVTQFLVIFLCSHDEQLLDVEDRMGLCHYIGEYCSQKALFVCTTKRLSYCCFQSKLSRVIQEQGRAQLGMTFGSPKNPDCSGFTVAEFQKLDLSKMDFSEVFSDFTSAVKLPATLQTTTDIQAKIQAYYAAAKTGP